MDKKINKENKEESQWDKKKILFVTFVVFIILFVGFNFLNSTGDINKRNTLKSSVKGVSTSINLRKNVQDQINNIKNEASNIDIVDIATSSPQVQKIINDLKTLKDYPNNQLKQSCMDLCSRL